MNLEEIHKELKKLLNTKKYTHSMGVMETSIKLAKIYNADVEKAAIAGLLHDCAKCLNKDDIFQYCKKLNIEITNYDKSNYAILHAPAGVVIANEKFNIYDEDILNAIRYHTTGRENMSILEKIIYISDYIEPYREFDGVEEARRLAFTDLNVALLHIMNKTISHLVIKNKIINYDTISARNYLVRKFYHDV